MECCGKNRNNNDEVKYDLDGLVCYCFKHSKKSLFEVIQLNEEEKIVNDIKKKMKDPGCFCESSNPSGKCCMADVMDFIKHFKERNLTS